MIISEDTVISRNEMILSTNLGDEIMMMSIERGQYFALEPVGARVWQLIEKPSKLSTICTKLMAEFDVDVETCLRDVQPFIENLHELQVVNLK